MFDDKVHSQDSKERDRQAVALDYETFYDTKQGYSLSTMSPQLYCADPRFDAYLVAICGWEITDDGIFDPSWKDGETVSHREKVGSVFRKLPDGRQLYIGRPENFPDWDNLRGRILVAHNAAFDSVVTDELARRGLAPNWLLGAEWKCTADLCAFLMVPRNLKGAMKELYGKEISKAVRAGMDGRHDCDLDADERRALVEYGGSDAVECHDIWLDYSAEWPSIERAISDQKRNATKMGIMVDRKTAEESLKELRRYHAEVVCDVPWFPEKPVGSLPALRQAVIAMGIEPPKSFKKDDPGFLDWQKEHEGIPFIAARQKAVAINMHAARIEGIIDSLDTNGMSHPAFLYFGAHTGRDSGKSSTGGSNTNMLNIPRKPVMAGDEHVFGGKGIDIRGLYIPRPGYKFVIADFSQVEARFLLWLVDDTHMIEAMKREGNLYGANAVAMGWCHSGENIKKNKPDLYRLAKCCLTGDSLVLVRSEKKDGGLTSPYYKRIIRVTTTDKVWDGWGWVSHLGVEKMKEVYENELGNIGGVWATHDHKVYSGEHDVNQLGDLLEQDKAAAVAWGQSTNPVQGWTHVRLLAAALARLAARAVGLAVWKGVRVLAGTVPLHRVWTRGDAGVAQREEWPVDTMQVVRTKGCGQNADACRLGEDS